MAIDTGIGGAFTFSGLTGTPIEITPGSQTIDTIDISDLATTGHAEKLAADLIDAGEAAIRFQFDPTQTFPTVGGVAASLTLTWPTQNTSATYIGTAILTSFEYPALALSTLQEGTASFTFDGVTGPTWTQGT